MLVLKDRHPPAVTAHQLLLEKGEKIRVHSINCGWKDREKDTFVGNTLWISENPLISYTHESSKEDSYDINFKELPGPAQRHPKTIILLLGRGESLIWSPCRNILIKWMEARNYYRCSQDISKTCINQAAGNKEAAAKLGDLIKINNHILLGFFLTLQSCLQ